MINTGTLIISPIRPNDSNDLIASAFDNELKGTVHSYTDTSGRNSIIEARRSWGMLCAVNNDGTYSGTYQLIYGHNSTTITDNSNWVSFTALGASGYSGLGLSGYSGQNGTSGYSGLGLSGYSGQSGASGEDGFSGYSGQIGVSGASGASGIPGTSGYSGQTGSLSITGLTNNIVPRYDTTSGLLIPTNMWSDGTYNGIGTTNPQSALAINGDVTIYQASDPTNYAQFSYDATKNLLITNNDDATSTASTVLRLRHTSDGTTAPAFGSKISFDLEDIDGVIREDVNNITSYWQNNSTGYGASQVSSLKFGISANNTPIDILTLRTNNVDMTCSFLNIASSPTVLSQISSDAQGTYIYNNTSRSTVFVGSSYTGNYGLERASLVVGNPRIYSDNSNTLQVITNSTSDATDNATTTSGVLKFYRTTSLGETVGIDQCLGKIQFSGSWTDNTSASSQNIGTELRSYVTAAVTQYNLPSNLGVWTSGDSTRRQVAQFGSDATFTAMGVISSTIEDDGTGNIIYQNVISRSCTGGTQPGFGNGYKSIIENNYGNLTDVGKIEWSWADAFLDGANLDIYNYLAPTPDSTGLTMVSRFTKIGNLAIGNVTSSASTAKLQVGGAVQIKNLADAASADLAGSIRYYKSDTTSYMDMCMQTGTSTYTWVNIKTNTW